MKASWIFVAVSFGVAVGQVPTSYRPIAVGAQKLVACTDGHVYGWGYNEYAIAGGQDPYKWHEQLHVYAPQPVVGLKDIVQVAYGFGEKDYGVPPIPEYSRFSLALERSGVLWGWGFAPWEGQLAEVAGTLVPERIAASLTDIVQVDAQTHVLALRRDGTVWGWGTNYYGELSGSIAQEKTGTPTRIMGIDSVIEIRAGRGFSVAVRHDGSLWWWGTPPISKVTRWYPERIEAISDALSVSIGYDVLYILRRDGTVWRFGITDSSHTAPERIEGLSDIFAIAGSGSHLLAIRRDSTLWAWGSNEYGELGIGSDSGYASIAVRVPLDKVIAVAVGKGLSFAVQQDGTVWSWGTGDLGLGQEIPKTPIPLRINVCTESNVAESTVEPSLRITPTLSSDGIFEVSGTEQLVEVVVSSVTGQTHYRTRLDYLPATVNLSHYPRGVYAVVLRSLRQTVRQLIARQ
ncbi:MAG: hypothetical protein N3B17_00680 [Chlorobi bacterium]|nr:hypothetical protein [Chlorobiota bacterium]